MFTHIDNYSVQETRREARAEGKAEGMIEVAKKLLKKNRSISEIVEITGISRKEVEKLRDAN